MTLEEYLKQPFKSNGDGTYLLVEDEWDSLSRNKKRFIKNQLKKGKVPDFLDLFLNELAWEYQI